VGRSLRQALYLCGALSLVGIAILLSPVPLLRWTEVPPALWVEVGNYLAVLALALPPALLFRIYSTLNQASGPPQVGHVVAGGLAVHQSDTVYLVYFFR
jgi:multidrug resistance protein, MATE family